MTKANAQQAQHAAQRGVWKQKNGLANVALQIRHAQVIANVGARVSFYIPKHKSELEYRLKAYTSKGHVRRPGRS
jgi:hypothetical protein